MRRGERCKLCGAPRYSKLNNLIAPTRRCELRCKPGVPAVLFVTRHVSIGVTRKSLLTLVAIMHLCKEATLQLCCALIVLRVCAYVKVSMYLVLCY